ncbi:MAG: hypothetical protein OXI60_07965 [Acidiferrobacterales bacterium]|nr:hypothetical protein [Acidiferrobacterales bacterium]
MHWIALAIVCTALVVVSYYSPKVGFSLLGAVGALVATLYFLNLDESSTAGFPIERELVQLDDVKAEESYGESWDYSGRVSNSSSKVITDVLVKITLRDCPSGTETVTDECPVIGEQVDFVALNVPPRQARDFQDNISFRNAVQKGILFWDFELVGVRVTD